MDDDGDDQADDDAECGRDFCAICGCCLGCSNCTWDECACESWEFS